MIKEKCILNETRQWEQLVCKLHFLDIKILEYIYFQNPGTTYFKALTMNIYKLNIKRTAIRNHIAKLEELGLIETVKSGILLINSVPEISDNVKRLILRCKMRWNI